MGPMACRGGVNKSGTKDKQFYGDLFKNFERTLTAVYARLQEDVKTTQDETAHKALILLVKQVGAMNTVLRCIKKNGTESQAMYQTYRTQWDFLQTSPTSPCIFPVWLVRSAHKLGIEASGPKQFSVYLKAVWREFLGATKRH